MADIQLIEEPQYISSPQQDTISPFTKYILSTGIVSTQKQAEYVLLGLGVLLVCVSLFLIVPESPSGIELEPGLELTLPAK